MGGGGGGGKAGPTDFLGGGVPRDVTPESTVGGWGKGSLRPLPRLGDTGELQNRGG